MYVGRKTQLINQLGKIGSSIDRVYWPTITPVNKKPNNGGRLIRLHNFAKQIAKPVTKHRLERTVTTKSI